MLKVFSNCVSLLDSKAKNAFCNQLNINAIQLRASSSNLSNKERKILRKRKALEKQAATEAKEKLKSTVTWSVNMKDSRAADERLSKTESCKSIKDLKAEKKPLIRIWAKNIHQLFLNWDGINLAMNCLTTAMYTFFDICSSKPRVF